MAIIKCKMCGGDLDLIEGQSVAECEYCGSRQTVPTVDNEKKLTLFARANRLRAACEFDKAAGIYESIVADFPEEAEAYWGLVLCKFGIEYVDDPATGHKIPTCHRSSFDSILEDGDFEQAMENADAVARRVYREEAKQIEEIRKGIIAVSSNEESYDVFICYKETDEKGERTLDSVLAQDIYDAVSAKGYRTFFARITLEDKLGVEYEPYIFAALHSAKIMLAVGTDYEYYNAVWVKNEWSRYLKLMAKDKDKHLIPCFKNLDAYDMPKEFARLQAQDLGKVGAMQDLLRGIEKILPKKQGSTTIVQMGTNASAMVMRGQFALDDGDWMKAEEYFERALDQNPQDGGAYLGKVLALLHLSNPNQIDEHLVHIHDNKDFDRAIRFSEPATAKVLSDIRERAYKKYLIKCVTVGLKKLQTNKQKLQKQMDKDYDRALRLLLDGNTEHDFREAAYMFRQFGDYRSAKGHYEDCIQKAEQARIAYEEERLAAQEQLLAKQQAENERLQAFDALREPYDVRSARQCISGREKHSVAIKTDGTVVAVGDNDFGRCNVQDWEDIVSVTTGRFHTVGLRSDGSVVAVGDSRYEKTHVARWKDVISVSAGDFGTVGLKKDGTVYAIGCETFKYDKVAKWTDICSISAGACHTVGLKRDGTVVAEGDNSYGQCNVRHWKDIVAISARGHHTLGLKTDGTVVASRYIGPANEYCNQCEVQDWTNIVDISVGAIHSTGLRADGTVVATKAMPGKLDGQLKVSGWNNISSVCSCMLYTIGLRKDGTAVACGKNDSGQCNVSGWRDLIQPPAVRTMNELFELEAKQSEQRKEIYLQRAVVERKRASYRSDNLCQHCGGSFKGLFAKKCVNCGKPKDY